jgi:hypothetical protein
MGFVVDANTARNNELANAILRTCARKPPPGKPVFYRKGPKFGNPCVDEVVDDGSD